MIEIRAIDPIAEAARIVEAWHGRASTTFPLDERLLLQQLRMESAPKACFGAFDAEGKLVGAALAKRANRPGPDGAVPNAGFLSFIVVDARLSRRGIGSRLLAEAEAWLAGMGADSLRFGSDRYHFFPGAPLDDSPSSKSLRAFLEARGFAIDGARVEEDLIADLRSLDLKALAELAPIAPGYRFRFYEDSLRGAVEAFFQAEFPGRWSADTFEALDAGMRGADLALLQGEGSGEIVGFSRVYDPASPILGPGTYWRALLGDAPGGLGPIGVSRSVRGRGLGLAFLRLCVQALAARGVGKMVIDWTGLGPFYAKMGFSPWKAYGPRSKALRARSDS